jgi:SAM-dependent methyltransferase
VQYIINLINEKLSWANDTIHDLNLHVGDKKYILELGCGIGCLSKILKDYGHKVVSCDDKNYSPTEFSIRYDEILSYFNHPRLHFHYLIPLNDKNRKINKSMFDKLQQETNNTKFNLILWQAFDLFQLEEMQYDETLYLVKNLLEFLKSNGKIIIGYAPFIPHTKDAQFESTKAYRWLQKWRSSNYTTMGDYVWEITHRPKTS